MHSQNPFLDEFAKLTQAAMGIAQTAGEEAKTAMRAQADRLAAEFDLIRRDDFEALKAEVAALREEVIALHRTSPLTARQIELVQQSDQYLNRGQGFDMHWWAWECLMGVLGRPISADVAVLKPQGAAQ